MKSKARMEVKIAGLAPVVPHRWNRRAYGGCVYRKPIGNKDHGARDEARAALYCLPDGRQGMPAIAFKAALVEASRYYDDALMVRLKQLLFVEGEGPEHLVSVNGTLHMREDMSRNASGVVDLRYRYEIRDWSAVLVVRYVPSQLNPASVIALVDAAGRVGVGDWRPSSPKSMTGIYGTWRVKNEA